MLKEKASRLFGSPIIKVFNHYHSRLAPLAMLCGCFCQWVVSQSDFLVFTSEKPIKVPPMLTEKAARLFGSPIIKVFNHYHSRLDPLAMLCGCFC